MKADLGCVKRIPDGSGGCRLVFPGDERVITVSASRSRFFGLVSVKQGEIICRTLGNLAVSVPAEFSEGNEYERFRAVKI